jgi:inorganic pyrophosphatase
MEYLYLSIFLLVFSVIILLIDGFRFYTMFAFILGALTSVVSGYIGMWIATRANGRVAFQAYQYGKKNSHELKFSESFNVAFRGGCVMGFCLVSLALFNLTLLIMFYHCKFINFTLKNLPFRDYQSYQQRILYQNVRVSSWLRIGRINCCLILQSWRRNLH